MTIYKYRNDKLKYKESLDDYLFFIHNTNFSSILFLINGFSE